MEYILSNPVYTGKLRRRIGDVKISGSNTASSHTADRFYRGQDVQVVSAPHIPLITEELFRTVQKRLDLYRECSPFGSPKSSSKHTPNTETLFSGLVRCSACGSSLVSASRGRALQCSSYTKGRCLSSHYISLKFLRPAILRAVKDCPLPLAGTVSPSALVRVSESEPAPHPKAKKIWRSPSVGKQIQTEEKRLERLRLAYESGTDSLEEYRLRKQEIQQKIAALKETEKEGPGVSDLSYPSFSWNLQGLARLLDSGLFTISESNELLRLIFSRIIFDRAKNTLQFVFRR